MNNKWYAFFFLILAVLGGFYFYNKSQPPSIDFKTLNLSTLDGKPFELNSLKGKKLIVCFGASWCGNCIEELNAISKIKDNELNDVEVLVISDEPMERIADFKTGKNYPFTFIKLNQAFASIGITSIPTTYFLNTALEVKKQKVGYIDWNDASTIQHLKTLMD